LWKTLTLLSQSVQLVLEEAEQLLHCVWQLWQTPLALKNPIIGQEVRHWFPKWKTWEEKQAVQEVAAEFVQLEHPVEHAWHSF
jgi:hypothetical protein